MAAASGRKNDAVALPFECNICGTKLVDANAIFTNCGHFFCAKGECTALVPGRTGHCELCSVQCTPAALVGRGVGLDAKTRDFLFKTPVALAEDLLQMIKFHSTHRDLLGKVARRQLRKAQVANARVAELSVALKSSAALVREKAIEVDEMRCKMQEMAAQLHALQVAGPSRGAPHSPQRVKQHGAPPQLERRASRGAKRARPVSGANHTQHLTKDNFPFGIPSARAHPSVSNRPPPSLERRTPAGTFSLGIPPARSQQPYNRLQRQTHQRAPQLQDSEITPDRLSLPSPGNSHPVSTGSRSLQSRESVGSQRATLFGRATTRPPEWTNRRATMSEKENRRHKGKRPVARDQSRPNQDSGTRTKHAPAPDAARNPLQARGYNPPPGNVRLSDAQYRKYHPEQPSPTRDGGNSRQPHNLARARTAYDPSRHLTNQGRPLHELSKFASRRDADEPREHLTSISRIVPISASRARHDNGQFPMSAYALPKPTMTTKLASRGK